MFPKSPFCLALFCLALFVVVQGFPDSLPNADVLPLFPEDKNLTVFLNKLFLNGSRPTTCTSMDDPEQEEGDGLGFGIMNGMRDTRLRWKNYYIYIGSEYSQNERNLINNAAYRLSQELPCVNFGIYREGSTPSGDYINIKKDSGCWSYVGRQGGRQDMSLANGCMHVGVIMHEMIHALGFQHEQCRPDRDDFINIYWQNIQDGQSYNFDKNSDREVTTYGVPYNTKSIMQYDSYAFSKNRQPTILTKSGQTIDYNLELVQTDIDKMKKMYNC